MKSPNPEQSKGIVMLVGGVVAIVLIIIFFDKIMQAMSGIGEGLGMKDSKEGKDNKKVIDKAVNKANELGIKSAWSPNYYKQFGKTTPVLLLTVASLDKIAKQFWSSVGYMWDTPANALAAVKQLKSKTQLSQVAEKFYQLYGKDLIGWLNDKFDIMGQREYLRQIIDYVDNLPTGKQ